jgi:hypothetical protein
MTFDDFKDMLDQVENGDHLKDRMSARNELLAWAQAALESRVLAEKKPEPIYQKQGGIAYGMISWIDVDKKTFDKATIKRIVYAAPQKDAQTGE